MNKGMSLADTMRAMVGPMDGDLAKMLNDARAEGMADALEIAKEMAIPVKDCPIFVDWDGAEEAIAERQAALRCGK